MTPQQLTVARQLYESRQHTVTVIAKTVGVSRASIYRHHSPERLTAQARLASLRVVTRLGGPGLYGVIPTLQSNPHFGRVYAADGGVFVVLSLVWGRVFDGYEADRWDLLGALLCQVGVRVLFFGPRGR